MVQDQEKRAVDVLSKICKDIDCKAIIAGGAPRDWDMGKKARDIDVYLRFNTSTVYEIQQKLERCLGSDIVFKDNIDMSDYVLGLKIKHIINVEVDGELYQFIDLDECDDLYDRVVKSFDLGICRIARDQYYTRKTKEYNYDNSHKTITFYHKDLTDVQLRHSLNNHVKKILNRFASYQFRLQ